MLEEVAGALAVAAVAQKTAVLEEVAGAPAVTAAAHETVVLELLHVRVLQGLELKPNGPLGQRRRGSPSFVRSHRDLL